MTAGNEATARDVVLAIALFLGPPASAFLIAILREVWLMRRELRALKLDQEASAAEGYPPPGPPTTDSLSEESDTL